MKIGYFPVIYPDELLYSVFSRFYAHSGYPTFGWCAKDIYGSEKIRPDMEFANRIRAEIKELLEKQKSWEQIIMEHTMYPYYSRFLGTEKREIAKQALLDMGDAKATFTGKVRIKRMLSVPIIKEGDSKLRYCPLCVKEDREKYGETYWHRRHQIRRLDICYKHGCRLEESSVDLCNTISEHNFRCAENEITLSDTEDVEKYEKLLPFISYLIEVLEQKEYAPHEEVIKMLYQKAKTSYSRGRKKHVDIVTLHNDFQKWKQEAGITGGILESWQIEKIFSGYRKNPYEICQLSYFLEVNVKEMMDAHYDIKDETMIVDKKIVDMIKSGKCLKLIAKEMEIGTETVRAVCREKEIEIMCSDNVKKREQRILEEREYWLELKRNHPDLTYNTLCEMEEHRRHLKFLRKVDKNWTDEHWFHGVKKEKQPMKDWDKVDRVTLPLVKDAVRKLLYSDRPERVSMYSVGKITGLKIQDWRRLPMCRKEVEKNIIPLNELWARKVVWAVKKMQMEGVNICPTNLIKVSGITKESLKFCIPYLNEMMEPELVKMITDMI